MFCAFATFCFLAVLFPTSVLCARVAPPPSGLGKYCDNNAFNCTTGLSCVFDDEFFETFCTEVVGSNSSCEPRWVKCQKGLSCQNKICRSEVPPPSGIGKFCDGADFKCEAGLSCSYDAEYFETFCTKFVGINSSCAPRWVKCEKGLACENEVCVQLPDPAVLSPEPVPA